MKYTWLVEKYLEGELNGEELRRFELEILRKPQVAEELERIRTLNRFMEDQHQKMRDQGRLIEDFGDSENIIDAEEIGRDLESLKVRKISSTADHTLKFRHRVMEYRTRESLARSGSNRMTVRKTSLWIAAASLVLVAVTSTLALTDHRKADFTTLFDQYYDHRIADVPRAVDINESTVEEALRAYNNNDYEHAFGIFEKIPEEKFENRDFLYKALTAMELGKYRVAIEIFHKLNGDEVLEQDGMWYTSLCYLKLGDEKEARKILTEIIRKDGYYRKKAQTLRRKI